MRVDGRTVADEQRPKASGAAGATVQHLRGSSLLLVGRVFSLALGFGSQVLLVRYLSKSDFGSLGYALSAVALLQALAMLETSSVVARFLPVYRERQDYGKLFGAIVLAVGVVTVAGALSALAIAGGVMSLGIRPTEDPLALRLIVLLAPLIPLQGVDTLFTSLFAVFGSARSIALRQSILAPGLRMTVVLLLIVFQANVLLLAVGYLVAALLGVLVSVWMFVGLLRRRGSLQELRSSRLSYPAQEMFGFAVPLFSSTLVWALIESSAGLLLGYFHDSRAVADFRAALPLAQANLLVSATFATLYMPLAARLHARGDRPGLTELYWRTALLNAVLSFPIFVVTFSFAQPVTTAIFGSAYSGAAPVLALLSLAYFFQTATGFNGLTLKVFNKLRYVVAIDIASAVTNLLINLVLIPRWGVLGAATGTAATMILHNLLKQYDLWRHAGITPFPSRKTAALYAVLLALPLLLGLLTQNKVSLWITFPLGFGAILLVLWMSRAALQVTDTFPELERWAIVRAIIRPRKPSPGLFRAWLRSGRACDREPLV